MHSLPENPGLTLLKAPRCNFHRCISQVGAYHSDRCNHWRPLPSLYQAPSSLVGMVVGILLLDGQSEYRLYLLQQTQVF